MVRWSRHCADTGLVYLHGMYYQCGWDLLTHLESLQVVSSVIAAWSDVSHATSTGGLSSVTSAVATLNIGYIWMFGNCLTSAAYVSISPGRRDVLPISSSLAGFGYAQEDQSDRLF